MKSAIRILAPTKEVGDLFTRLVSDLFLALGYDHPRLNIHKSGREIDVDALHRLEPSRAVAECKATARPIGGDDVNKFAGVLDAERRRTEKGRNLVGYFISLSGFTEAAWEQEKELGRLILLDGPRIVEELIRGRIVVSPERALVEAGRCAATAGKGLIPENRPEMLAHALGWVWAVRFRRNAEATHVALIHADGEALSSALANEILDADRKAKGDLHRLAYLAPRDPGLAAQERLDEARQTYFRYLAAECGEIELEGLPADHDIGTRRLRLESLFVPLHLEKAQPEQEERTEESVDRTTPQQSPERVPVGQALASRTHLAILALPGGGKTTLLKRLAVAYAFPERRLEIGDLLPDRPWFPLFLRCRQIEERATKPIIELLGSLGERAELGDLSEAFRALVLAQIREGKALLLIDGLDEIADPGLRMAFVHQLRTFLSTYPGVSVIVTSREAGFRLVAGSLSAHCDHYRIASFDQDDIERLTVAWHREVVGNKPDVAAQARALAASIWDTDRVRRLAVNPLLLTTLLLVRRWVGQLPNKRSVLYEKAIEVLLWTWNVEGFKPLDVEEVTPQLAFLAWQMMEDGVQQVSQPRLREILQKARQQMPEVLGYAKLSVSEFVDRVEGRSGLLALSGQRLEDGRLVPVYEFRHLTFQEYLAAKGLVEGYYPDRAEADTLVSKLEPHFEEGSWKEVVPLVAVLAGRKAAPLVEALVVRVKMEKSVGEPNSLVPAALLLQCLFDEVQIPSELIDKALDAQARLIHSYPEPWASPIFGLASGRYGQRLKEIVWRGLSTSEDEGLIHLSTSWLSIGFAERKWPQLFDQSLTAEALILSRSEEPRDRSLGLLLGMILAWSKAGELRAFQNLAISASEAVFSSTLWEQVLGTWALVWLSRADAGPEGDIGLTERILALWLNAKSLVLMRMAAWSFREIPILRRDAQTLSPPQPEQVRRAKELYESPPEEIVDVRVQRIAGLLAGFYWRQPWSDEELARLLLKEAQEERASRNLRWVPATLSQLGEAGRLALREFEAVQTRKTLTPTHSRKRREKRK